MSVDVLVIGAGATGASLALEGSRRGLKVALVEAGDIAVGTSSRSTKLLHGGVRYLELAFKTLDWSQLQLVREALAERGHWMATAPFLARRLELLLPTVNSLGKLYYGIGLGVYDALAGQGGIGSSRWLPHDAVSRAFPGLAPGHGGVAYSDGQFDDARLNLLIARTAARLGAEVYTRTAVMGLTRSGERLNGAVLEDTTSGRQRYLEARVVINATGIRADSIRRMAQQDLEARVQVSRGVHLVLEADLCPAGTGLLVPATDDGRVLFFLPFFGRTLVGTTDTACSNSEAELPSAAEESYLLDYVRRWFPGVPKPSVSSRWAGGRPLLRSGGGSGQTSKIVREHVVETLPTGLVSVMGGKWTTCRPMALDGLEAAARLLDVSLPAPGSDAARITLHGAAPTRESTLEGINRLRETMTQHSPQSPVALIEHLLASHGLGAEDVLACAAEPAERQPLSDVIPLTAAEVRHAVRHEWARSADDVLARRCRLAFVDQAERDRLEPAVQTLVDQELDSCLRSPMSHQKNP